MPTLLLKEKGKGEVAGTKFNLEPPVVTGALGFCLRLAIPSRLGAARRLLCSGFRLGLSRPGLRLGFLRSLGRPNDERDDGGHQHDPRDDVEGA